MEIIADDFLIHGKDQTDADQNLRIVLDRSREVGWKFNPKKAKLCVPEVSYRSYLVIRHTVFSRKICLWVAG